MKCSDCRKPMDPIVSVDIDGTLGFYHQHFVAFAEDYLGRELPRWTEYQGDERFWEFLGLDLPEYRTIKLHIVRAVPSERCRRSQVVPV